MKLIENGEWKVSGNVLEQKSFRFAVRIVNLSMHLRHGKKEYVLSNQRLRSGTSIGANISEAQQAQSRVDFISKLGIALKETTETNDWLRLLRETDYITMREFDSIIPDCIELEKCWWPL